MKKRLIKWLGGYTFDEVRKFGITSRIAGKREAIVTIREFMKDCNGLSANLWCDTVWKYINAYLTNL